MTYDSKDSYVVLFGGIGNFFSIYNDTWEFRGGHWKELSPTTSPSPRAYAAMTYDAADGYVLLFGGWDGAAPFGDTWTFSGGQWTELSPTAAPSPRYDASMAYDAKDGYVVLYGGYDGAGNYLSETWKFVGGKWTELTPARAPSPRTGAAMVYDANPADQYVVLFGGVGAAEIPLNDTWKFVGGVWTNITHHKHPPARYDAGMAYDAAAPDGYVVLFGGYGNDGNLRDTWTFTGGVWTKVSPPVHPTFLSGPSMVYDPKTGYTVLFGGEGDSAYSAATWTFLSGTWTRI